MKLLDFFKPKEAKASRTFTVLANQPQGAQWSPRNYEKFAKEAYVKNIVAYRCIDLLAKSVASVPWRIYREDGEGNQEELRDHPLARLFRRPNPDEGWASFMVRNVAFYCISGQSFIERVGPRVGDYRELYSLRPDRIKIKVSETTGRISKYIYTVGGKDVEFEVDPISGQGDLLQIKNFHPVEDWWGLSGIEPAARDIDINNEATDWNKSLLQNGARPSMIMSFEEELSDSQFVRFKEQLIETYSGAENAGKPLVFDGGAKATAFGWTPSEIDFLEGNRETARRICWGFGVPPMLVGIPGDNTYSNYQEARLDFWETTVDFILTLYKSELNNWLLGEEENDVYVDYDLNNIPALIPRREAVWERAQKSDFLTINEKRKQVGLEAIDGGDQLLVPSTLMTLNEVSLEETEEEGEETEEGFTEEEEEEVRSLMKLGYSQEQAEKMIKDK